jgi:hypothetical protein
MSTFPGVCVPGASAEPRLVDGSCPPGSHFAPRPPGELGLGRRASTSAHSTPIASHYFTPIDVPLGARLDESALDSRSLDAAGIPVGLRPRRDALLRSSVSMRFGSAVRAGPRLELPIVLENVGAGHRVPAGFSQERELWVELTVRDAASRVLYQVGRVGRPDQDLPDKRFLSLNIDDRLRDARGRPLGVFGADVADGPDVPEFDPPPALGGTAFRGRGLINFQNGFLRCVRCIGRIDAAGDCQPGPGQGRHRADRYADADYDPDTGACASNLRDQKALFEVYFPVGALDASRGVTKAADAIIDTRSLPPGVPISYTYELPSTGAGPVHVLARLLFRAYPPFLLRAFAAYEARKSAEGLRPSGPLLEASVLEELEIVELVRLELEVP